MGTKQIRIVDWSDRLLTKTVLYYDLALNDPSTPRRADVVARSTEPGCVHLMVYGHPVLDANRPRDRYVNNVLVVRDIADRPPGNSRVALLLDDQPVAAPTSNKAQGAHLNELTTAEDRAKGKPKILIAPDNDLPEEEKWDEIERDQESLDVIEEDEPEEPEQPKTPPKPLNRAEMLLAWDPMKPLTEIGQATIVNKDTIHIAALIAEEWVDIVRIVHVMGEDAMSTGYTMRVVDAAGRMSIDLGALVPPSKTDAELKAMISVAKKIIAEVTHSPDQEEANNRLKTLIHKWRSGKLVIG